MFIGIMLSNPSKVKLDSLAIVADPSDRKSFGSNNEKFDTGPPKPRISPSIVGIVTLRKLLSSEE